MREDPVRMIRAVRFAVKLGLAIEPATHAAMELHRGDLVKAAVPRLVEETFKTLALAGAERAFTLLDRLGILELLLPFLAEHLASGTLARERTVRNLAAMGRALEAGQELSRPFILGCLFADYHLSLRRDASPEERFMLVDALRARGYSKADTEHMRLLLEAPDAYRHALANPAAAGPAALLRRSASPLGTGCARPLARSRSRSKRSGAAVPVRPPDHRVQAAGDGGVAADGGGVDTTRPIRQSLTFPSATARRVDAAAVSDGPAEPSPVLATDGSGGPEGDQ